MRLRGLVEMFASRDHDEPDVIEGLDDGPIDHKGCRIVVLATLLAWAAIGTGVYFLFFN